MVMTGAIEGEKGIRVGLDNFQEQAESTGKPPNLGRFGQEPYTLPTYEWLQALAAAASGDYRVLDEWLAAIIPMREQSLQRLIPLQTLFELIRMRLVDEQVGLLQAAIDETQSTPMRLFRDMERQYRLDRLKLVTSIKPQTADIYAVRGILALEAGNNAHAEEMFRKVVSQKDPNFVPIAEYFLKLLDANR